MIQDLKETAPCGISINYSVDSTTDFVTYNDINGRGKKCEACSGCTWYGLCKPQTLPTNGARIYISGAITGTVNYLERFAEAEKLLEKKGYTVINPAKINAQLPLSTTYEEYMSMSLYLMDMCNVMYQLNGWENSKGANREYGYALAKDFIIFREGAFDDENDTV